MMFMLQVLYDNQTDMLRRNELLVYSQDETYSSSEIVTPEVKLA